MNYRRDIDGLRAVAVLLVLLYHCNLGLRGGYVGVDVFFVISGYLITRLLNQAVMSGQFSFVGFWERRIRRLVPALAAFACVTTAVSWLLLLPVDLGDFGGALASQPILMANCYLWMTFKAGYFADPPEIRPLLHTWSLGVEEQFYLLYPVLICLCLKVGRRTPQVLAVLALGSFLLSCFLTPTCRVFAYFLLPTRAWELLLGGLLAYAPPSRIPSALGWSGLALIGYAAWTFNRQTPFPGSAALVPCLGAALFLWANDRKVPTQSGRLLSGTCWVALGRISYSLYLWHWPIVAWGNYLGVLNSTWARLGVVVGSLLLAYLSWRWVEEPFRQKRVLPGRTGVVLLFCGYASLSLWFGFILYRGEGFPDRWSSRANQLAAGRYDRTCLQELDLAAPLERVPRLGERDNPTHSFLLWGDSHAMSLAPVLDELGRHYRQGGLQVTRSAEAPLADSASAPVVLSLLEKHSVRRVYLAARWLTYGQSSLARLEETVSLLGHRGVRVFLVCDVPLQSVEFPPRALALATRWPELKPGSVRWDEHLREAAPFYSLCATLEQRKIPGLTILDPAFLVTGWTDLGQGGRATYVDDHRLTDHGALLLRPLFEPAFREEFQSRLNR